MFVGFSESGEALYDTKESALARAAVLKSWDPNPETRILVHRRFVPLFFAHLVQGTFLEFLAYEEVA